MIMVRFIFSVLLITLVMTACSDDPVQMGPFHGKYHCDLNGRDYTYDDYTLFCTEYSMELEKKFSSIDSAIANEKFTGNHCVIDDYSFSSSYGDTFGSYTLIVIDYSSDSFFRVSGTNSANYYHIFHCPENSCKEYECTDSLDSKKVSVMKELGCNDTLAIKSVIEYFDDVSEPKCMKAQN
jgi:hypothetical protein